MKYSKDKLNESIKLYLNDLDDYGDETDDTLLAESILTEFQKLTVESEKDTFEVLKETILSSPDEHKVVYKEFLEYLKEIQ
jgi:hypothetical protein